MIINNIEISDETILQAVQDAGYTVSLKLQANNYQALKNVLLDVIQTAADGGMLTEDLRAAIKAVDCRLYMVGSIEIVDAIKTLQKEKEK